MKLFLLININGGYIFDEDLNIKEFIEFPEDEILNILKDRKPDDLNNFFKEKENFLLLRLKNGLIKEIRKNIDENRDIKIVNLNKNPEISPDLLVKFLERFSDKDFFNYARSILLKITADRLINIGEDKLIIQHVETLDQVIKVFNILMKRIREYYSMKSPELIKLLDDNSLLLNLLAEKTPEQILNERSISMDLTIKLKLDDEEEIKILLKLAEHAVSVIEKTKALITKEMSKLMPITSEVATPIIGAKLLTLAGGFEKLAVMPSSRIQLLGAEKALFRHLKQGSKPPKYGVLYQHPYVLEVEKKLRGKAARKIASKIAISVRKDYFGKHTN